MSFVRLLSVAGLFAAVLSACPRESAAESRIVKISISKEMVWSEGYMGLGGGLGQAIVRGTVSKTAAAGAPIRPRRDRAAPRYPVRAADKDVPIALIAAALDSTGYNISNIAHSNRR